MTEEKKVIRILKIINNFKKDNQTYRQEMEQNYIFGTRI